MPIQKRLMLNSDNCLSPKRIIKVDVSKIYLLEKKIIIRMKTFEVAIQNLYCLVKGLPPYEKYCLAWIEDLIGLLDDVQDEIDEYDKNKDIIRFSDEVRYDAHCLSDILNTGVDSLILDSESEQPEIHTFITAWEQKVNEMVSELQKVGYDLYNVMIEAE